MEQTPNHPTITTAGVLRPTYVEIDLARLTANFHAIQKHVGDTAVMPILKANAYGHGLVEVARHMVSIGAERIGVAFLEEGILLREAGIKTPIMVLGGILGSQVPLFVQHDLIITASSQEKLQIIDEAAAELGTTAKVHLKIDTGMERIGVHYYSAGAMLEASLGYKHIQVEGIFSHFANADAADLASARLQLERFMEALHFYEERSLPTPMRHMANSGAVLQLPEANLDMVRPGRYARRCLGAHGWCISRWCSRTIR
jgi:alanine racemase